LLCKFLSPYNLSSRKGKVKSQPTNRIDALNMRIDRLYEAMVKKEDHEDLRFKVRQLEERVSALERRGAA